MMNDSLKAYLVGYLSKSASQKEAGVNPTNSADVLARVMRLMSRRGTPAQLKALQQGLPHSTRLGKTTGITPTIVSDSMDTHVGGRAWRAPQGPFYNSKEMLTNLANGSYSQRHTPDDVAASEKLMSTLLGAVQKARDSAAASTREYRKATQTYRGLLRSGEKLFS